MALTAVADLRERRGPGSADEIEAFETDVLAGFVLARASAGLVDETIRNDLSNLQQVRVWFGRPLWEMQPADADAYFGRVLRQCAPATRTHKAGALSVFFEYLELRHKIEIYNLTGTTVESPLDEMNRPRSRSEARIRVPPGESEIATLFAGWRSDLASCRKYATAARNYAAARLMSQVGLRVNEARTLDLDDVKWDVGRFGKLHVRHGKGSGGKGPKERLVPLINGGRATLEWFIGDVWGHFGDSWDLPGAPLLPSERSNLDGSCRRVGYDALRASLHAATERHLPQWRGRLTPHVLRHFCASELYLSGMDLLAIQELLGHEWVATTMRYVHVHRTHIEDAWAQGEKRAAQRLEGLLP